ncbi:transcriptional regulator [Sphingomonas sp. VNH70]|uniref:winged helix-turn-helix domain-containing protein n=1 Tax=Sphingomonas silueang TaxID=3156617 RepID=UPI0032B48D97
MRFGRFTLDPHERTLRAGGAAVELNARYLDALILLAGQAGRLVSKDRFMETVWHGIPVTDEALTQCIRTLRRTLGDTAQAPHYIETVPRHGYRFIAPVERVDAAQPDAIPTIPPFVPSKVEGRATGAADGISTAPDTNEGALWWETALATTAGGALAGLIGGLTYGFAGAAQPLLPGTGASAVVLVLLTVTLILATLGAGGVGIGMALATRRAAAPAALIAGGAAGGCVTGAIVKLIGGDLFALLFGHGPGPITGAPEGLALGAATGAGLLTARALAERDRPQTGIAAAAAIGGLTGAIIVLLGGRLLGGSLSALATAFPASRLRIDTLGLWFGESGFGPVTRIATAALEGALFTGCIAAMVLLRERRR